MITDFCLVIINEVLNILNQYVFHLILLGLTNQMDHSGVLPLVCVCYADDIKGICDEQWYKFSAKAWTSEMLTTVGKFAKWPANGSDDVTLRGYMYLTFKRVTQD